MIQFMQIVSQYGSCTQYPNIVHKKFIIVTVMDKGDRTRDI